MKKKIEESNLKVRLKSLGPGIITGAADDDPAGIATYTMAGSQFGMSFLWASLVTWPLMASVEMACARIGMVTGQGLSHSFLKKFPKFVVATFAILLFAANSLNVGADLSAMADAAEMLGAGPSWIYVILFALIAMVMTVELKFDQIVRVLKWLTLSLFSYVVVALLMKPDWGQVLSATLAPRIPATKEGWGILVAILGTTISPYLFYWQASMEVEEEKDMGRKTVARRRGATHLEIQNQQFDVGIGTFVSTSVMFFIILAAALSLHKNGITEIESSRQAAEALKPLAGEFSSWIYALALISTGFIAIPTLTGSSAYSLADTFNFQQGLNQKWWRAKHFYVVILASGLCAVLIDFTGIQPLKALYWSAVINGLLAPFMLLGILLVVRDAKIMGKHVPPRASLALLYVTLLLMTGAAIGLAFTS